MLFRSLGNSAYVYLSVAFIQMVKALMPCVVYLVGVAFKVESFFSLLLPVFPGGATARAPPFRRRLADGAVRGDAERSAHAVGALGEPRRISRRVDRTDAAPGRPGVLHASRAPVEAVVDVGVLPDRVVALEAGLDVARALRHARVGGHDGILARPDRVRPVDAEKPRARGHGPDGRGGHGGQGQRTEHEARGHSSGNETTIGGSDALKQRRAFVRGARRDRGSSGPRAHIESHERSGRAGGTSRLGKCAASIGAERGRPEASDCSKKYR